MKNLKKTLAVVLAFVMVLSMGLTSFAYTDVTAGTKVAEAVGVLSNLNILTGFEDGTFRPDETVTRAQMAAIICRVLGMEDQAVSSQGTTAFSDVAADHWASGYVNVAQAQQIINGYPDGTFRPENQVAYEEAIKMVVVALGRELEAQKKGGWSQGYLAAASSAGITKNANGTVGSAAARSTIAILVYNSLEVRLMDQNSWTTSGDDDRFVLTDDTILSKYLEVEKWEGTLAQVPVAYYAQNDYAEDAETNAVFAADTKIVQYVAGKLDRTETPDNLTVDCTLVPEINTLAGKKVVAYIGENAETGIEEVVAIAEKEGANSELTISATQLISSGADYTTAGSIFYKKVGATKSTEITLAADAAISVNFGAASAATTTVPDGPDEGSDPDVVLYSTSDLAGNIATGGTITFISNDGDDKIDLINVVAYDEEAVIEAVEVQDEMIDFDLYTGTLDSIDTEDKDILYIVYKDGAVATVNDLAANDTVSYFVAGDSDSVVVMYASSKTVTGTVDTYKSDYVTIGGEKYEISADYAAVPTTPASLHKKEGIFFLNVDGQIAWDEADAAAGNYALVIATGESSGLNGGYVVEVVLADGTSATYPLHSKAELGVANTDALVYAALVALMDDSEQYQKATAFYADVDELAGLFYQVKIVDGKVKKLTALSAGATAASTKEFDEENMSYGNVLFNDSTVVFSSKVSAGTLDSNSEAKQIKADDIVVGKVADFFVDGEGGATLAAFDESQDIAGLVLGYDLSTTVPQDGAAVIISGEPEITDIDDVEAYIISGIQGGQKVTYTLCNDNGFTSSVLPQNLVAGDVILVGPANADGIVSDFITLYTVASGLTAAAADDATDDIYYVTGDVLAAGLTDSKFFLDNVVDENDDTYVALDGITMKNSANYTLVDFTEDPAEVSKKAKGKAIFGNLDTKYDAEVFVRYYDDKLVEVVVYRTAQ